MVAPWKNKDEGEDTETRYGHNPNAIVSSHCAHHGAYKSWWNYAQRQVELERGI